MSLQTDVLEAIRAQKDIWWSRYVEGLTQLKGDQEGEWLGSCPYPEHEDSTPSFNVNVEKAAFICRGCGKKGNAVHLHAALNNVAADIAVKMLAKDLRVKIREERLIPDDVYLGFHASLMTDDTILKYLLEKRGLTEETIKKYHVGYCAPKRRITIPVLDGVGKCVNIRMYRPKTKPKMLPYQTGYGRARIFPLCALDEELIFVVAGELDMLIARQNGINAITCTTGETAWPTQFSKMFKDKEVVVIYDCDSVGAKGARRTKNSIGQHARRCKTVNLRIPEIDGGDITDWFVTLERDVNELLELVENTPWEKERDDDVDDYAEVSLFTASRSNWCGKKIKMPVLVSGKDTTPYLVPRKVKVTCEMDWKNGKPCAYCPVSEHDGVAILDAAMTDDDILKFIDARAREINTTIRAVCGIPRLCTVNKIEIVKHRNVEKIQLTPEIDTESDETRHVSSCAYYLGHGLNTNSQYVMEGRSLPDPTDQHATQVIHRAIPAKGSIDAFEVTPELVERLQIFQAPFHQDIKKKLDSIYDDMEFVTGIYGRRDTFLGIDLIFHSVIGARFQGRPLPRSWVQGLILGDTRCGKTESAKGFASHYRAGEVVAGERVSFAGLVGALDKFGSRWILTWGKFPLSDRRAIVIDEVSGMSLEDIGSLSSIRSSGIAEVIKVVTEKTTARVRALWLSNPRASERNIASYTQGVLAIPELIGRSEDISRFDFILTTASGEIPLGVLNRERQERTLTFTSELCHELVMWCWSRKGRDVEIPKEVEGLILHYANEQGSKYSSTIPLVEPAEQRDKIARLAIALAARLFSTDATGTKVVVGPQHVDVVFKFLEDAYSKPSLAYDEYSKMERQRLELKDEGAVAKLMSDDIREMMLGSDTFYKSDLQSILGIVDRHRMNEAVSIMISSRAIRRSKSGLYIKTEAFTNWIRRHGYKKHPNRDTLGTSFG